MAVNEAMVNEFKSEDAAIVRLLQPDRQDPLIDPLADPLLDPPTQGQDEESCGLEMVTACHELTADLKRQLNESVKREPGEVVIVMTEPQVVELGETGFVKTESRETEEIEVVKTEPQEIDATEMILPNWCDASTEAGNEPVVMETEYGVSVFAKSSELKNQMSFIENPPMSHVVEFSVEDQSVLLQSEKEQYNSTVIKEEDGNIVSPDVNRGVLFSNDHGELMSARQCLSHSDEVRCAEELHYLNKQCSNKEACVNESGRTGNLQAACQEDDSEVTATALCSCDNHVINLASGQCCEMQHFVCSGGENHQIEKYAGEANMKKKQFDCQYCGQTFSHCSHVKTHVRTVHLKEKQFECQHCGQKFGQSSHLNKHVRTVHLKEKNYECGYCGHKFSQKINLTTHEQSVHLKEKLYECRYCGQRFNASKYINVHIQRVHLKEKQYACRHCGQKFNQSSHMKTHIQTVHLKEKIFECQHCGQRFGVKGSMNKHIRTVHLKKRNGLSAHIMTAGLVEKIT